MNDREYTKAVKRELIRLARLVATRQNEARLKNISATVGSWKKKKLGVDSALNDIRQVVQAVPPPWSETADPGMPVAQGISEGLISKKELSPAAWNAIQVLIAVVEV